MNWIESHWIELTGLAILLAGRIVELTPTDKDNKILDAVVSVLKVVALKVGPMDPTKKETK